MQQQDNQKQQGTTKKNDQLRKPMESQANKPATESQVSSSTPPSTEYNQEKHWANNAKPAVEPTDESVGLSAQDNQQSSQRQAGEDRSKSFGESQIPAGGEVDHSNDDGVIPKENSFPNYSNPSSEAKDKQDYTH